MAYVIHLDEYSDMGTHWIAFYALNNLTYFDSFVSKIFQRKFKKIIKGSLITRNIFTTQAYNSVMCGYFCIGFINLVLRGKTLLIFFHQVNKKDDDII